MLAFYTMWSYVAVSNDFEPEIFYGYLNSRGRLVYIDLPFQLKFLYTDQ